MSSTHYVTREQFSDNIDGHLDLVRPGDRVEINKKAVLIHPDDLRFLDKCAEALDNLPVGIESLIEDD